MKFLYNIGVRAYGLGVITAGLLGNEKAVKWVEGRRSWQHKLKEKNWKQPIWIHASSLGEFEQAKPLIEKIKNTSNREIIVTFFSPSGYDYCRNYELADGIFYLPLDIKKNARVFLEVVKPSMAVFVKYDFWFNFLQELQNRNIPTLFFSSNFRENQIYFKKASAWQRSIMRKIDFIFCMNEQSATLLRKHEFINVGVCGDTRFDRVSQNAERCVPMPLIKKFKGEDRLLILGSSWPVEEEILQNYFEKSFPDDLKVIIAPHDISEEHLKDIESRFERGMVRYSRIQKEHIQNYKILLIDNIGMLANCYQYGDIAFVGGGFTNSLHNILEAASMGNVLLYGDDVSKYPEGGQLQRFGGSFMLENGEAFISVMEKLLTSNDVLVKMQERSRAFVGEHKGATDKVYNKVLELLKD
jgi:3-deoxy-D-manno-octulosonic-acid transferase